MTDSLNRISLIAAAAALALGLAACNKTDDRTVGQQVDAAVAKTETIAAIAQTVTAIIWNGRNSGDKSEQSDGNKLLMNENCINLLLFLKNK